MLKIDKKKFHITFTKGTGAGGQHRNKVETCAVITHIETGITEKCEETRYKNKNLETAYKRLITRLDKIKQDKKHEQLNNRRKAAIENNGIIRTYNFQRNEVKDHRTKKSVNLKKVLNGRFDLLH